MANQKRPFHEILSTRLDIAALKVSRHLGAEKEVEIILDVLLASKMPAWAAHQIARYFTNLPGLLFKNGWDNLSKFAEEVLNDLKSREDEEKGQPAPVPAIAQ